jgi:hypothetical protein
VPDGRCSALACPIPRAGRVPTLPWHPATVFSEALGFRIGGVSLMPLRLVLAYAIISERVDGNRDDNNSSLSHAGFRK